MAKRDTRRRLVATLGALLLAASLGLWALDAPVSAAAGGGGGGGGACRDGCYRAKSSSYRRCRVIPPTDRASRNRCFKRADATLRRCLSRCRKKKR